MNRVIRYRAWDKENNKMYNDVEFIYREGKIIKVYGIEKNTACDCGCKEITDVKVLLSDYEIIQYTGLKDKHDVPIFEGDIVKFGFKIWRGASDGSGTYSKYQRDEFGVIELIEKGINGFLSGWMVRTGNYGSGEPAYEFNLDNEEIEVVGNIMENAELLPNTDKT